MYVHVEDGYLWEEGPNSFQPTPSIMTLLRDLNLLGDLVVADPSLPRYIFFDGRMHSLPRSLRSVVSNSLLSWRGKIAILLGSMGLVSRRPVSEESIHHFITRHFGINCSTASDISNNAFYRTGSYGAMCRPIYLGSVRG